MYCIFFFFSVSLSLSPFKVVNVNGSGIGMGHPVGSTGSRIIVSLIYELMASKKRLGLASICGGGGVSLATEVTLEV